jgi:hypothetical protein
LQAERVMTCRFDRVVSEKTASIVAQQCDTLEPMRRVSGLLIAAVLASAALILLVVAGTLILDQIASAADVTPLATGVRA